MKHGFAVYLDNGTGGFTQVDGAPVFIRYRRAMDRLREFDGAERILAPATVILG